MCNDMKTSRNFQHKQLLVLISITTVIFLIYQKDINPDSNHQAWYYRECKKKVGSSTSPSAERKTHVFEKSWFDFTIVPDNNPENNSMLKASSWYTNEELLKRTKNCDDYFSIFPVLALEEDFVEFERRNLKNPFSLAFSHLVHKDIAIFEVFLSVYFRPNNFHCIHVDVKASHQIRRTVSSLVECYSRKTQNGSIFVIPVNESTEVDWGGNTMLIADIKCHQRLLDFRVNNTIPWRYSLSVAGSELPITSYLRFHNKISQKLGKDEKSSVESFPISNQNINQRFTKSQLLSEARKLSFENNEEHVFELFYNQTQNITFQIFKGSRAVILSSKDADFIVNHPISRYFYYWFQQGSFTEEHFYATVIRLNVDQATKLITQNTQGKILRQNNGGKTFTEGNTLHGVCLQYVLWGCSECQGKCYNAICNFHRLDLNKIAGNSTECLMANKFNLEVDPFAVTFQLMELMRIVSNETQSWQNSDWESYFSKIINLMV